MIGFKVSRFQSFKASKIYQMSISCFLEDIDLISKTYNISQFVGARLFQNVQHVGFSSFRFIKIITLFKNDLNVVFDDLEDSGVSKNKNSWLGGSGTRPKIPES